ncbi:hypothetical protein Slin14017_G114490 [Septoria linicola]|nr:hypothetical protein Slin14017_G114490 [Septoria linicola]
MSYHLESYKRNIICCDGTWMASNISDGSTPSNIGKLARAIAPSGIDKDGKVVKQIVSYHNGLYSTSLPAAKATEGSLGWGLDNEITQVYEFISNNYEVGDETFFFGFPEHFSGMWEAYRARDSKSPFEASKWYRDHKEKLELNIPLIKTVGVFDTVGALGVPQWPGVTALPTMGIPLNQEYAFHDTALPKNVEYASQALALDEKRITFPPTLWHKTSDKQHLEQCWFPGVHANIGGQAEMPLHESDRGEIAANTLAWMMGHIDNISNMLTFESTALDLLAAQHAAALLQMMSRLAGAVARLSIILLVCKGHSFAS